jgi:hypothetical protein
MEGKMNNDDAQAPVVDDTQIEDTNETEVQEQAVSEPINEGAEAPTNDQEPVEEQGQATLTTEAEEEDISYQLPTQPYEFQAQDGYVDPNTVAQEIHNRVLEQVRFERSEAKAWEKIEQKYPQVKNDKELREIILNQRVANAYQGKNVALPKIADTIMSRFTTAKSEGRAEANVSRKIQKSASLETSTANQGDSKQNDTWDRISNGDSRAADDLFSQWIKEGKI